MPSVHLVTRHADLASLSPMFERAGMSAFAFAPERLEMTEITLDVDAVVIDLRDVPQAAFEILRDAYADHEAAILALVDEERLSRLPPESPVDDFIFGPPNAAEVVRRLERAIYRKRGIDTDNFVRVGTLAIDLANYRVTVDGQPVVLTFKEYELLRFLATNAGRVFTREQLLNRVWGYDYFGGARTVDVHIRRIRSKIETGSRTFIETVRNVGYRLVADK